MTARPNPSWPAWFGPAAFSGAFIAVAVFVATLGAVVGVDLDDPAPEFTLVSTLFQDAALVAAALLLARTVARPRPWQFGFRRVAWRRALGWTVLAGVTFYVVTALYSVAVSPDGEQTIVEDLGADQSTALLLATTVLVVGLAPFVEEFFFRGFFFGALRTRFGLWSAALINGLVFGAIHYSGPDTLSILPPLAFLGLVFCLLYARTGSLYPAIALHAFNNAVALTVETENALPLAAGVATIACCCILASRQPRIDPKSAGPKPLSAKS